MIHRLQKDSRFGSLFFVLTILLCVASCNTPASSGEDPSKAAVALSVSYADTIPEKEKDSLSMGRVYAVAGVGDMMLGTNYPNTSYLPLNGGKDLLTDVQSILSAADLTFGNLEGVLLDSGGQAKRCNDPSACYAFRSPEIYVQHFVDCEFDMLSLANNHSGDFGPTGRSTTKRVLAENDIAFAGLAGSDEMTVVERNGLRFGMAAFAPNSGTCDIRNISYATGIVRKLSEQCDVVIVSFHGGAEGAKAQRVPRRTETYYGENRGDVYKFAHAVVDVGADIVFGHGPHVTRAMEVYKDRLICYSLGNFCTYGRFNVQGVNGIAPIVTAEVDAEGRFVEGQLTSIYQQKTHGPKIDSKKRALAKVIELTELDFPNTPLRFDPEGRMYLEKR